MRKREDQDQYSASPLTQDQAASRLTTQTDNLPLPPQHSHALELFDRYADSVNVSLPVVQGLFGCSRATIYRWVKNGYLPAPKKFGPRISRWNVGELRQVLAKARNDTSR